MVHVTPVVKVQEARLFAMPRGARVHERLHLTHNWQKRLGKNWKRLHRSVYIAVILVIGHFWWSVKDPGVPLRYGAIVAVLLIVRIPAVRKAIEHARQWLRTRWNDGRI